MYTSKHLFVILMIMAVMPFNSAYAQVGSQTNLTAKRKQSIVVHLSGGFANYISGISAPVSLHGDISKISPCATIRAMWHPGFRLNIGLESGVTNFYSYAIKNNNVSGKLRLSAVPILVVWSMPVVKRLHIFAGFGSYLLTTHLQYNEMVKSTTLSLGSNIALSYTKPLSKNLGLGAETEWMSAFETKDNMLAFKVNLVWRAFEF